MSGNGSNGNIAPDFLVSVVRHYSQPPNDATFRDVLEAIAGGEWARPIAVIRETHAKGGKVASDPLKKNLPGIMFSGSFSYRDAQHLVAHSGLICADLDHLNEKLEGYREHIIADPHVLACFTSPSGTGLKVIFRIDPAQPHFEGYRAAEQYVQATFGLEIDSACSDVSRLCFVSHDPEAFVAKDALVLPYPPPLEEVAEPPVPHDTPSVEFPAGSIKPGEDYDQRGPWKEDLESQGWTRDGDNFWVRPGKTAAQGAGATWGRVPDHPKRFYVFTSNAPPLKNKKLYKPWHLYAEFHTGGDLSLAAKELYAKGYGTRLTPAKAPLPTPEPPAPVQHIQLEEDAPSFPGDVLLPPAPIEAPAVVGLHRAKGRPIFDFNLIPDTHESVLLGNRYLNRGDAGILASTSGMGKSTLNLQMATELAINLGPLGIKGNGPLRSLIVQSEDGEGDIGEVAFSLKHVLKLSQAKIDEANSRVHIYTDRVNRGLRFFAALKDYVKETKPDLVWLNPLQAFMDGDITAAKDLGAFLRDGLNGVNADAKFAYMGVHHTTKPAVGPNRADRLWHEVMYDMAGGAELINWARAILSLRAGANEGEFNLVLAKRGRRAGVTKKVPQGVGYYLEPVTTIPLRHSKERVEVPELSRPLHLLYWEPREADIPPANPNGAGRPEKYAFADYRTVFPSKSERGLEIKQLWSKLQTNGHIEQKTLQNTLKRWEEQGHVEVIKEQGFPMRFRATF